MIDKPDFNLPKHAEDDPALDITARHPTSSLPKSRTPYDGGTVGTEESEGRIEEGFHRATSVGAPL